MLGGRLLGIGDQKLVTYQPFSFDTVFQRTQYQLGARQLEVQIAADFAEA